MPRHGLHFLLLFSTTLLPSAAVRPEAEYNEVSISARQEQEKTFATTLVDGKTCTDCVAEEKDLPPVEAPAFEDPAPPETGGAADLPDFDVSPVDPTAYLDRTEAKRVTAEGSKHAPGDAASPPPDTAGQSDNAQSLEPEVKSPDSGPSAGDSVASTTPGPAPEGGPAPKARPAPGQHNLSVSSFFIILDVYELANPTSKNEVKTADSLAQIGQSEGGTMLYHSELLFCPRSQFKEDEAKYLEELNVRAKGRPSHKLIPKDWWTKRTQVYCNFIVYGGGDEDESCSGVSLNPPKWNGGPVTELNSYVLFGRPKQLSDQDRAAIPNVNTKKNWKYIYGTANEDAPEVRERVCAGSCGDDWKAESYGLLTRNCNTFSRTVLHCILKLGQNLPHLGPSALFKIKKCRACSETPRRESIWDLFKRRIWDTTQ